jgi:multidrug resistance efflux pump
MISARLCALSVATLLLALAGCGSSLKAVTKAQYEAELASFGRAVTLADQQLGKSTTAADFSGAVANLQKVPRQFSS